jgi:hypothetical protein
MALVACVVLIPVPIIYKLKNPGLKNVPSRPGLPYSAYRDKRDI